MTNKMEDDNSEYVEEEVEVLVELAGIIDPEVLLLQNKQCKVLGIDTQNPVLQIDNYFFTGPYEEMIGTAVLFEESSDGCLKHKSNCSKKLNMKRAFLEEKFIDENVDIITADVDVLTVEEKGTKERNTQTVTAPCEVSK